MPADDLDGMSERFARAFEECLLATRDAQRVGADDAHAVGAHVGKPLAEAAEAGEAPCADRLVEPAVGIEPCGEAHHLAQPIDDDELAGRVSRDDHVETVGAEIDRGQDVRRALRRAVQAVKEDPQPQVVRRVGIADDELRAFEVLAVVDLRAGEVLEAHRVDQQLDAVVLDQRVAVLHLLVELEAVLQAGAAAALHVHAQHEPGIAFATDQLADLPCGGIGEIEQAHVIHREDSRDWAAGGPAATAPRDSIFPLMRAPGAISMVVPYCTFPSITAF